MGSYMIDGIDFEIRPEFQGYVPLHYPSWVTVKDKNIKGPISIGKEKSETMEVEIHSIDIPPLKDIVEQNARRKALVKNMKTKEYFAIWF